MKTNGWRKNFLSNVLCVGLIALAFNFCQPSYAADPGQTAMAQFNAKQYKQALQNFRKAIQLKPRDANLYYYSALCQQYMGDIEGAKKTYYSIVKYFPGSDAALQAGGIIGVLERQGNTGGSVSTREAAPAAPAHTQPSSGSRPASGQKKAPSTAPGGSPKANSAMMVPGIPSHHGMGGTGSVTAPDECNLHFERINNSLILDATVNDRPIKVLFDTGAENCCFGKNHLQEMSLRAPSGPPTGKAGGVGDGGVQDTWDMPVTIRIGPITRKDFAVSVQTQMSGQPLLGETFFQDFTYTIDNGGNNIHVVRKNKQTGSIYKPKNDPYAVPFTRMGNEIIVQAEVNGRPCPVIFDTGASVCAFTKDQVGSLGISIPEDAQQGISQGIAGTSTTSVFPIRSIKVGPIEKHDFEIHVVNDAKMPAPLLGQTFYGDWQYTIDYENRIMHFLRR